MTVYGPRGTESMRTGFLQYFGPNGSSLPLVLGQLRPDYLLSDDTILNGCVRFIPIFSTTGVAFSDARKAISLLAASGSLALFTIAAANT